MEQDPWTLLSKEERYRNPWILIEHHKVLTPAKKDGIYGVVRFYNIAIGIVTLDAQGNTHLIGQWRYPLNRYSWEIPEGGCPHNEDPLEAAKRELQEETGYTAAKWTKLAEVDLSNSVTDETGVIFLAEELTAGQAMPEETEVLQLKTLRFAEAVDLVVSGIITDSISVIGFLAAERLINNRNS